MRRYRAELKQSSILCFLYCVRCGDGTRVLYEGSKSQCDAVATELETAFRDGEFVATSAQQARVRELEEALLEFLRDEKGILGKLARFADSCAEASFDGCDIDGWTIQEWMEGEGLLVRRPDLVVPCGEFCSCSESMGEGQKCDRLFLSDEFKQALSATAREPKS